jgi:transmembrane protein 17
MYFQLQIPELASFWLISTLLQFPLQIFLVFDRNLKNELHEKIFNAMTLLFLLVEILIGTFVLKQLADRYAKNFYMAQIYGIKSTLL